MNKSCSECIETKIGNTKDVLVLLRQIKGSLDKLVIIAGNEIWVYAAMSIIERQIQKKEGDVLVDLDDLKDSYGLGESI